MRRHSVLALSFLAVCGTLFGDTEITREEATTLRSYDLNDLMAKRPALEGQLIRLKFNYRSSAVEKKDGAITGRLMIWRYQSTRSRTIMKSGTCVVSVPEEGVQWFLKLPTTESRGSLLCDRTRRKESIRSSAGDPARPGAKDGHQRVADCLIDSAAFRHALKIVKSFTI